MFFSEVYIKKCPIIQKKKMDSLLEQQRCFHEETERLMEAMVGEKMSEKKSHKEILNSDHRQRAMINRYMECSGTLIWRTIF